MTTTATHPNTTATEDRLAILELIGNLALLLDARAWNALEGLFTDPVDYDRTRIRTGAAGSLSRTPIPLAQTDSVTHAVGIKAAIPNPPDYCG